MRLDQVTAVEDALLGSSSKAVLLYVKGVCSWGAVKTCKTYRLHHFLSLNSLLLLPDLLLLDLASLSKNCASTMQTSTAFALTVCDSNYSPQPNGSVGSDPVLKPQMFLKSLCSVEIV